VVEELLPTAVTLMAQMNVDKWITFWLDGFLDKGQSCLPRGAASLFDVAFGTGANDVLPNRFSADASWDNVVKGQLGSWIAFATILTSIFVASEDVTAVEFYIISRQTVVK